MKKIPIPQSANPEEKKELEELLDNISRVNKMIYGAVGGFSLVFSVLSLTGVYLMPRMCFLLLFLILVFTAGGDFLLKKTKLKERATRVNRLYSILLIMIATMILLSVQFSETMPFTGALILTVFLFAPYFAFTRRNYCWAVVASTIVIYVAVVTLGYLGIFGFEDVHHIGIDVTRNADIFINILIVGTAVVVTIFLFVDTFSKRLRASLGVLSQKEKELEEAKGVLEIKVEARTRELEQARASLEERVKERTKELQERLEELERFHKLTVGRELKMVELKEEIKELKKALEKDKDQK